MGDTTYLIKYKCFEDIEDVCAGFGDTDDFEDQYYFHHAPYGSRIHKEAALDNLSKLLGINNKLIISKEIIFVLEGHVKVIE